MWSFVSAHTGDTEEILAIGEKVDASIRSSELFDHPEVDADTFSARYEGMLSMIIRS